MFASVLAILAVGGVVAYCLSAVLSDGRTYSKASLDYLILTPEVIKGLPLDHSYEAQYTYSAADGPKPAICTLEFAATGDQDHLINEIGQYLKGLGLTEKSPGVFVRDGQEVLVHSSSHDARYSRMRVEVLDFLS
jgi:hypothetical protein